MQSQKKTTRPIGTTQNGQNPVCAGIPGSLVLSPRNDARLDGRLPAAARHRAKENSLSGRAVAVAGRNFVLYKRDFRVDWPIRTDDPQDLPVSLDCPTLFDRVMHFMDRYYARRP